MLSEGEEGRGDAVIYSQSADVSFNQAAAARLNKCSVKQSMNQYRHQRGGGFMYLSVLCGMVGSMDTMAPDESSRDRLVFLHQHRNTVIVSMNNYLSQCCIYC